MAKNDIDDGVKQIFAYMKDMKTLVFQVVAPCGLGKSTMVPAAIAKHVQGVRLIVVEPRVLVAKENAKYVRDKYGVPT